MSHNQLKAKARSRRMGRRALSLRNLRVRSALTLLVPAEKTMSDYRRMVTKLCYRPLWDK
jgi:hypothetical protein